MVFYDHDVLDDVDVDKYYKYLNGETVITTVNGRVTLEAGYLQTRHEKFYGRSADGTDVIIPVSDVVSIEGGI